jgi:hypothetical protein
MRRASLVLTVILLTAACGGTGSDILGGLGGILGSPSADQPSDVVGSVTNIDTSAQRIDLNVNMVNNLRQTSTTNGSIYYDSNTVVEYQGNRYNVTDLERGDEISVRGANSNGRYIAQTITVTRNVRQ